VVADFHGSIIVDDWVARDDTDDRRGNFLPRVEFLLATSGCGAKTQKPGAERVDVKGLAVELGLDCRLALESFSTCS
jgi:hypothetical protein